MFRSGFLILLACLNFVTSEESAMETCSCAIFTDNNLEEPLLAHTLPMELNCEEHGFEKCEELCVTIAQTVRNETGALVCEKLKIHVELLRVGLWVKSCDVKDWRFTGLSTSEPICCHDGKDVDCLLGSEKNKTRIEEKIRENEAAK